MKKKYTASFKDKKDWLNFTKQIDNIRPKEEDLLQKNTEINRVPKLDLHGFSLGESNEKVKKFIIKSYNSGYKKLIIVTGKGLRSKTFDNPFVSEQMSILKNSVPDYISNDGDLSNIVKNISKADMRDGGDGAIYISLKRLKKL